MRGYDSQTEALFTYVTPESFVPKDHPLRAIRTMADDALAGMDKLFDSMYATTGRSSIPPEKLLKAQLLMILYSIRSNRQLVEQIHYNFLFRWFLGMSLDEKVWDHSSFTKNKERLIGSEVAAEFLSRILDQAERKHLLSREHFTVDGTLIEAWASIKSFKPKDGPPSAGGGKNDNVDFKGQKLTNDTHGSVTDPDARLYRKGKNKEAKLCYLGHTLMENRSGLIVRTKVTTASGTASAKRQRPWYSNCHGQPGALPWAATKATTRQASSKNSANSTSRRMWPRTIPTGSRPLTAERPTIQTMPSA